MSSIPFLTKGDQVVILSPASPPKSSVWLDGVEQLKNWGLEVVLAPNHLATHYGLAGTDAERLADLQWALNDPSIKAIFPIRGGYGSSRIVDQIDFTAFLKHPKWIIGFSDITTLLMHVNALRFPSIHGPMPHNFLQQGGELALTHLHDLLFNGELKLSATPHSLNKHGFAQAEITGGNLSLVVHLIGTNSLPDLKGKILFLEDIGERLYHVDRMLVQLKRAGLLAQLSGLLVGGFTDCEESSLEIGKNVQELILEHTTDYQYPIAFDFPSGHIPNNQPIIFGATSNLLINSKEVQLTYHP